MNNLGRLKPFHITILDLVSQGLTRDEVGKEVFLASDTVKAHLRTVFRVLEARNAAHAVRIACDLGILGQPTHVVIPPHAATVAAPITVGTPVEVTQYKAPQTSRHRARRRHAPREHTPPPTLTDTRYFPSDLAAFGPESLHGRTVEP